MRARMTVDARDARTEVDYHVGQELEGEEAAYQVALGHAEVTEADPEPEGPKATEAATAAAEDLKVDLSDVKGTGKGGTITKGDVAAAAPKDEGA